MKSVEYFTHSTLSDVLNHTMNFWSQKSDCETKQTDLAAAQGKKLLIKQRIPGWIGLARRPTVFEATYEINLKPVPDGTQIRVSVNFPFKARLLWICVGKFGLPQKLLFGTLFAWHTRHFWSGELFKDLSQYLPSGSRSYLL